MSMNISCFLLYCIASTIIVIIFISLCQYLLCPNSSKSVPNRNQRSNSNHRPHRASISGPPSVGNSNHNRTHSVSAIDIERIIPPSNLAIPISNDTSATATPKNNDVSTNIGTEKSVDSTVGINISNPSHTRSESYTIQIRASLPHAVTNLVSNIKGMLHNMEHKGYESNEIQLLVRISSITAVFGFLICVVMLCVYFMIELYQAKDNMNTVTYTYNAIKVWCLILYGIGKFSLYLCTISRLYYTLEGGIYQYNIIVYAMITFYLIIDFIITISAILLIYTGSFHAFLKCILIFYIMDIFYLLLLYTLFTKQLLSLIRNTAAYMTSVSPHKTVQNTAIGSIELQMSPSPSATSENNNDNVESESHTTTNKSRPSLDRSKVTEIKGSAYVHKHKASGIEYVTKYTVLILWSVISSLSMIIMISVLYTDFIYKFNEKIIIHIVVSVDCIINSFAVYLYFVFGKGVYKLFCGICHNIASKIWCFNV